MLVNFGLGIWVAMYLTMAQEVSSTHISTAIGLLSGCGSLAGALAMWAVGKSYPTDRQFPFRWEPFHLPRPCSAAWPADGDQKIASSHRKRNT